METTFENARAGDRVWSVEHGWGEIIQILPHKDCKLNVLVGEDRIVAITEDGKNSPQERAQRWFWDEVKIEAPPRPKRKVKRTIEGWVNIYPYPSGRSILYDSKEEADRGAVNRIACVKLTGEYPAEE
jgi:hypothetical protein